MLATWFDFALKTKAIRRVPEGMCKSCQGTGNGEEIADLGEAFCHGELPMKKCASCGGGGMSFAKAETTPRGRLLLLLLVAGAMWVFPERILLILTLSVVSIAAIEAMVRRYRDSEETTGLPQAKKAAHEIFAVPGQPGPTTEGVLSLIDAVESRRQTVVERQSDPAHNPSHQDR
jgi:hypothetical protein